jgi:HEAT repeat protein
MAESDQDPNVRAAGIRALNRSRVDKFTAIYIAALNDKSDMVRLEGAKALANIPDVKAVGALMKILANEADNRDVRIASADALRVYKTSDVAQALIRVLNDRDFGVAWQARRSLNLMTGQDFRYNQAAWLEYLTGPKKPFG